MVKTSSKSVDAEEIAELADRGAGCIGALYEPIYGRRPTVQRVNVDLTEPMLKELDHEAEILNFSRQAVVKTMLHEALDRR